jgi:hypothetical protein
LSIFLLVCRSNTAFNQPSYRTGQGRELRLFFSLPRANRGTAFANLPGEAASFSSSFHFALLMLGPRG